MKSVSLKVDVGLRIWVADSSGISVDRYRVTMNWGADDHVEFDADPVVDIGGEVLHIGGLRGDPQGFNYGIGSTRLAALKHARLISLHQHAIALANIDKLIAE